MVKVSIVVPVYNTEKYIRRCLNSLRGQSLREIEIIVVDDGSTDNSSEIIKYYEKKDDRIRVIVQENAGLGAARNAGIREAKGEYIAFVDSDDAVDQTMMSKMYEQAQKTRANVVICEAKNLCCQKNGRYKQVSKFEIPGEREEMSGEMAVDWLLNAVTYTFNSACFKIVKRTIFIEQNIWFPENYRFVEDMPTSVGILFNTERVGLVHEMLYFYIHNMESITSDCSIKKAKDLIRDTQDILQFCRQNHYLKNKTNFIQSMLFSIEKQLSWSPKSKDVELLFDKVRRYRKEKGKKIYPDIKVKNQSFVQKTKLLISYYGMTECICHLIKMLKWLPFVKYMI